MIIDYGLGNLNSVARGVAAAGGKAFISQNPKDLQDAKKVILPGVGAFAAGMEGLKKRKFVEAILKYTDTKRELLGLCLGMQLLYDRSEEFGNHRGLCLVKGTVKAISPKRKDIFKTPHVGWNSLLRPKKVSWKKTILESINPGDMVYFVHSFAAPPTSTTIAQTEYGGEVFCSVISDGNIYGTQFHPEKSGGVGQKILRKFVEN